MQVPSEERSKSVIALVKLLDTLKVPMARANILWLVGQYAETLPKVGPDVLRQAVKNFANEVIVVEYVFIRLNLTIGFLGSYHKTPNPNIISQIDLLKRHSSYIEQLESIFAQFS